MDGDADSTRSPVTWNQNINGAPSALRDLPRVGNDLPELGSAEMAEGRPSSAAENRRHPDAAAGELGATKGVYAAADAMKPTGRDPMLDRLRADAQIEQLSVAHHAVLMPGQRPDRRLRNSVLHRIPKRANDPVCPLRCWVSTQRRR